MLERDVKRRVTAYLKSILAYFKMPVPTGYGELGLDYTCCIFGRFVAIETKRPGEWLTPRQLANAIAVLDAGGKVFVISNEEGLEALKQWVDRTRRRYADTVAS